MKHKHAELIKAWADGAKIETYKREDGIWVDCPIPRWYKYMEYRIKPDYKHDIVKYLGMQEFCKGYWDYAEDDFDIISHWPCKIKLTFNGETGKLISAEVL